MPTLLCRTSRPPQRETAADTIASQSAARVTSAAKASAMPWSAWMEATVSSARAFTWSTHSTRAPSRANSVAAALPLPIPGPREPAPVRCNLVLSRSPLVVDAPRRNLTRRVQYPMNGYVLICSLLHKPDPRAAFHVPRIGCLLRARVAFCLPMVRLVSLACSPWCFSYPSRQPTSADVDHLAGYQPTA